MRAQPPSDIQPPQITHRVHEHTTERHRRYRIITPLFGGGAIDHTSDEITVIRGTEIRGYLRFWWRATHAGHLDDREAVKKREDLIWGKANKKNESGPKHEETVQIEVSVQKKTEPVAPFTITIGKNKEGKLRYKPDPVSSTQIHPYVAFPIQPTSKDLAKLPYPPPEKISKEDLANLIDPRTKKISKEGIEFTLTITFPNIYEDEIEMALWAWETFGGIGARTRRGFGALQLLDINGPALEKDNIPPSPEQAEDWLKKKLQGMPANGHGFPYISPHLHFKLVGASDPMNVWKALIEKLAQFRQGTDGRNSKNKYGGRSYWPEAEAVRDLTGERRSDLPALGYPKKFPRAAFGLPIIFHFIREDQANKKNPRVQKTNDPMDATLQSSADNDRLASPLILKPLSCQNGQACGLALILDGYTIPFSLTLSWQDEKKKRQKTSLVEHQLTSADLNTLSSLKLNKKGDILEAFLDYLVGDNK